MEALKLKLVWPGYHQDYQIVSPPVMANDVLVVHVSDEPRNMAIDERLLKACKTAYRKHCMDDDSIGWEELSKTLLSALCGTMGDEEFQRWSASQQPRHAPDDEKPCIECGKAGKHHPMCILGSRLD